MTIYIIIIYYYKNLVLFQNITFKNFDYWAVLLMFEGGQYNEYLR